MFIRATVAAFVCLTICASQSLAAPIAWTSGAVTGDGVVDTTGDLIDAANFGDPGEDVLANGINFVGTNSPSNLTHAFNTNQAGSFSPGTGDSIDTMMDTQYKQNGIETQDLTITGLTSGESYLVQFFVANTPVSSRMHTFSDEETIPNTITVDNSGHFVTGIFTAVGTTQEVGITKSTGSTFLNGYQLRQLAAPVPEPSTLVVAALGALGLTQLRRRRRS